MNNRVAECIINNKKWTYPALHMEFDINYDYDDIPDISEIILYNLSPNSIARIKRGAPIIFNAGYTSEIGTIVDGVIDSVFTEKSGTDRKTIIKAINVTSQYLNTTISKTYGKNTNAKHIIEDILSKVGIKANILQLTSNIIYKTEFVAHGKIRDVLTKIVRQCKSKLIIRNSSLSIVKEKEGIQTGYLLNKDTGLIGVEKIDNANNLAEYKITSILLHEINAYSVIQVNSTKLKGVCLVVQGTHNNWKTEMEVMIIG